MWKSTASSWVRFILRNRLGPYSPMEPIVVERMLSALKVDSTDVLFDLGCGDGRVLVTAAKLGCRSVGVELDKNLASLAQENIRKANASHLAEVRCQNALTTDISEATAVTLYLSEHGNKALLPLLRAQMERNSRFRFASFWFKVPGLRESRTELVGNVPMYIFERTPSNAVPNRDTTHVNE